MGDYLDTSSPDAFKDIEKKTPTNQYPVTDPVECPVCHGHGKWNLRIDAYGAGKHFQAHCSQCNGWGYVNKGSAHAECVHEYKELSQQECNDKGIRHYGMCWHVYECTKCGTTMAQDSSD